MTSMTIIDLTPPDLADPGLSTDNGLTAATTPPGAERGWPSEPPPETPDDVRVDRTYRRLLLVLLAITAVAYLWGLSASGWANSYYSAAAQAGAKSWKAFFFGSFDSSNAITVDKPPAALWVMGLSARLFGVSSWSILVPQALMGVGTVALVAATVKRWFNSGAALLAGLVVASTPVAALMFRFNNPDALLVLLLTLAAYAVTRALEGNRTTRWLVIAGASVGLGFLAKMLQAFVVVPVFSLAILVAGAGNLRRRIRDIFVFGLTALAAGGWWVAIVELWPASSRPYIGGSQTNSVLELMFGYNGLGRLTGNETGSVVGGAAAGGTTAQWGPTGWLRLFNSQFGGQASWLIPAALITIVAALVVTARRARTDRTRAAIIIWGGWLLLTGVLFSLSKGIIHEYYTVALAPAIGAVVGIGASLLWSARRHLVARVIGASALAATAAWSVALLHRTPTWHPWLATMVTVGGVVGCVLLVVGLQHRRVATAAVAFSIVAGLAGPVAYSLQTVTTAHTGALPTAGPAGRGGFGGAGGPGGRGQFGGAPGQGFAPGGQPPTARPGQVGAGTFRPGGAGGIGGLLSGSTPSKALTTALVDGADGYRWVLATVGANEASGYQLATGRAVLAIGGFNGSDPSPTLAEFKALVAAGDIHYFLAGGGFGGQQGGSSASTEIGTWVAANYKTVTVAGTTLYDLSTPLAT